MQKKKKKINKSLRTLSGNVLFSDGYESCKTIVDRFNKEISYYEREKE